MYLPVPLAAFITYLLPVAVWLVWRKKTGASVLPLIIGFAAYTCVILPRFILRSMVSYNELHETNIFLYYLARGIISGGCEESMRLAVFVFLLKSSKREGWINCVSYGMGHGACESLLTTGLADCTLFECILGGCEFTENMAFSAAMSVLVYVSAVQAEDKGDKYRYFLAAYGLHFVIDIIPLVYETEAVGVFVYLLLDALFAAGCCFIAYKVFRRFPEEE